MKLAVAIALFAVVPLELALTFVTRGEYMPFIATPEPQQWNIQYLSLAIVSFIAAGISVLLWRRWRPAKILMGAAIWNAAWCGIGLWAVVSLWGEKV